MIKTYKGYCGTCDENYDYGSGCPICYTPLDLMEIKDPKSYTSDIRKAINLVSVNPKESSAFGSFIFKAQSYPSDIDVIESISDCCSEKKVIEKMYNILLDLVDRVSKTSGYFMSEIKAGKDNVYNVDVGKRVRNSFVGYDYEHVSDSVNSLIDSKLLDSSDVAVLSKLVLPTINIDQFDELKEFFRLKSTVRWTSEEIIQGYKMLPGKRILTLLAAISQKGVVKIDVISPIDGKYIEVTNFFIMRVGQNMINFSFDYVNQIKDEIAKYFSKTFFKPFKGAKRMWGLARHEKNAPYLLQLTPLFQSGVASLNQIISEIDSIEILLERFLPKMNTIMVKQIDAWKTRLASIDDIKIDNEGLYNTIDSITGGFKDKLKLLGEMKKYMKKVVNTKTVEYLRYQKLLPLPKFFL